MPAFYEFFAGGGMARAGLGPGWRCAFANDFDPKKGATYAANWGDAALRIGDVGALRVDALPGQAELAWASFPCQDLSLAGAGAGLRGDRSAAFWGFWRLMTALDAEDRPPQMIALENVCGLLTSHGGRDFAAIADAFDRAGYRFGAIVIDAALFLPQSRPRLFMLGLRKDAPLAANTIDDGAADTPFRPATLRRAVDALPAAARANWIWWAPPTPPARTAVFADLIEERPTSVAWRDAAETQALLAMMTPINRAKVTAARTAGGRRVGAVYKRTRSDGSGGKTQRAEVRFDDVAGCLRTPAGGSSRQLILVVDGRRVRSRLLSAREAARLMGLPDSYALPERYNDAYHLAGDGVAVPAVRWLAQHCIEPALAAGSGGRAAA